MKEGWEYARFHNQSYHVSENKVDLARRRRWLRKMTAVDSTKPAIFYFKVEPKGAKKVMSSITGGLSSLKSKMSRKVHLKAVVVPLLYMQYKSCDSRVIITCV